MKLTDSKRIQSLDVLRCVAILLVLGYHLPYYKLWARAGWIGVDLFFVLSGYLISGLLFREVADTGSINIRRFLVRRGLKIYPSFYLLIALAGALAWAKHSISLRNHVLVSAIFLQNYYTGTGYSILAHTWSLAVEEHFYILLPLLLLALLKWGRPDAPFKVVPSIFALLTVACLCMRWFSVAVPHEAHMTHLRLDSLFSGVFLQYLYRYRYGVFSRIGGRYSIVVGLILCLPAFFLDQQDRWMQIFGLTGLLLGFGLLLAGTVGRVPQSARSTYLSTAASRIGAYSYSIYLWHMVTAELLISRFGLSALKFWCDLLATIAVGVLMGKIVEAPYLVLRDRLYPSSIVNE